MALSHLGKHGTHLDHPEPYVKKCGGCGRFYPMKFGDNCPFCYVQEFLKEEAEDGACPVCGSVQTSTSM